MVNNKNNLQLYLLSKGFSIKDLKAEVVLIFCLNLLDEYFNVKDDFNSLFIKEECKVNEDEKKIIHNNMLDLKEYLSSKVLTTNRIAQILNDAGSKQNIMKARLVEPQSFFYNIITKKFLSKIKTIFKDDEKYFIPEQLIIYLIIDMKEKSYNFKKFAFVDNYDFTKLFNIYNEINIKLKRSNGIKLNTPLQEKTIISKMQYLSTYLVEELIKAKYTNR